MSLGLFSLLMSSPLSKIGRSRRRRPFQWYPDQSDWHNGAWTIHKNAQKLEWKTQSKISCHYTWLLQNCQSWWYLLGTFWTGSKPSRRLITATKRWEKEKKERPKQHLKNEKPYKPDVGQFLISKFLIQNFDFCACLSKSVVKQDANGKKGMLSCCKCIFE